MKTHMTVDSTNRAGEGAIIGSPFRRLLLTFGLRCVSGHFKAVCAQKIFTKSWKEVRSGQEESPFPR
jgi:hypothetical protein